MPLNTNEKRKYIRRVNSNGDNVYPTVCATQYKMPQKQGDLSGAYILDYFRKEDTPPPFTTLRQK